MAAENEVLVPLLILVQCSELLITWSKRTPITLVLNGNEKRQIDQTIIVNKYFDYKHESNDLCGGRSCVCPADTPHSVKHRFEPMRNLFCNGRVRCLLLLPLIVFPLLLGVAFRPVRTLSTEMLQFRTELTDYAREFVGIRYRYAGIAPETGFDCSGFTSYLFAKFNTELSRSSYLDFTTFLQERRNPGN